MNRSTFSTLFTAPTGGDVFSSPAVVAGVVYVGSQRRQALRVRCRCEHQLLAGDRRVRSRSGPRRPAARSSGSPAVANGVVFVGSDDHKLYAFDAAGTTSCSGTPKTCTPLWTATTGDKCSRHRSCRGGVVYVGSDDGKLYAFDATGTTNCSGTPKMCAPLWTADLGAP